MKRSKRLISAFIYRFSYCVATLVFTLGFLVKLQAQDGAITTYQYRRVPDDKIEEFIKRETKYWSKVAERAVKNKSMSFWALLEKVGGYDLPNSSNYLFINTFPNIDKVDSVFTDVESVAGIKLADMETNSFTTVTSQFFLHDREWVQATKAVPAKDFNYVVMNYQNTDYPDSLINLEKKYWEPFIKAAMDKGQTPQLGWGNAIVLAPRGENIKFTSVSYDLFRTLGDALMPKWDPKVVFPNKLFPLLSKIQMNRSGIVVYRVIKVVTTP
jgi:hypothetical protein